jgi:beta-lactam-binding protein with PASTA domain
MTICMGCIEKYPDGLDVCPHCGYAKGTPPKEACHLQPETIIYGKYIVGRVLGHGGFGVTYLGYDAQLDRKVAIKEYLPGDFSTRMPGETMLTVYPGEATEQFDAGMQQFIAEAQRLAKFNKIEGVVDIYDTFVENGTGYIVMQCLDGVTVKQMLAANGALPYDTASGIVLKILKTLRDVHKEGVIHRDISPDNIFITKDGDVKLIDFGAARYATTFHSKSLSVILKPGYAPEEQYRSRGNQGPWTDIYAMGATFYKMLTTVTPTESLERAVKDDLQEPSKLGAALPQNVENALMNALNVRVEDRLQSADEFIAAMEDGRAVERVAVKPPKADGLKMPKAAKAALGAAAGVAMLFAVLMGSGALGGGGEQPDASGLGEGMVNVPNVINQDQDDAIELAKQVGLNLVFVGDQTSQLTAAGMVMSHTPGPGIGARVGSEIEGVRSLGKPKVPDVTRKEMADGNYEPMEEAEAVKAIEDALGLQPAVERAFNNVVNEGFVILQTPAAETDYSDGDEVVLVISMGVDPETLIEYTTVPDFVAASAYASIGGMDATYTNAARLAESLGLRVRAGASKYGAQPADTVLAQDTEAGDSVVVDTEITLDVSLGDSVDPNRLMADLSGANDDAGIMRTAADMGLAVFVRHEYNENYAAGMICRVEQDPSNGSGEGETAANLGAPLSALKPIFVYVSDGKVPANVSMSLSESLSATMSESVSQSDAESANLSQSEASESAAMSEALSASVLTSKSISSSRAATATAPQTTTRAQPQITTTAQPTTEQPQTTTPAADTQAPTLPPSVSKEAPTLPGAR